MLGSVLSKPRPGYRVYYSKPSFLGFPGSPGCPGCPDSPSSPGSPGSPEYRV